MNADPGRWLDDPPLPEVDPGDPRLIRVRGAQLVRVHFIDNPNPKLRGFAEVAVIAWTRIPDSRDWAGLCAWLGTLQQPGPHGAHTTNGPRHGWLRMLPDRVESWRPPHRYITDRERGWHGWGPQMTEAIEHAAASLPQEMRERAVRPRE